MKTEIEKEFVRRYMRLAEPVSGLSEKAKQVLVEDAKEKAEAMLRILKKLGFEIKEASGK